MERTYRGFYGRNYSDGRGFADHEIHYTSNYRNKSKKNMEDMKRAYYKQHGYDKCVFFEFGYKINDDEIYN